VEIKDCDNTKRLERVHELFDNEIQTRLDHPKQGSIVVIAHRINEDDLPGHVLKKGGWQELKLPLIAPRARTYELASGEEWKRKKGELLRPDAFSKRDIQRLRASKQPGFETLHQQNPGGSDRLRLKAEYFLTFSPAELQLRELPIICQTRLFIRKYRPSAVLIEDTGQGPALISDINPQNGMEVVPITPLGEKVERLRKHRRTIRNRLVQLPRNALWYDEFISEVIQFPYGAFDDQMDALSQYLDWIAEHPNPHKRPPMAVAQGVRPVANGPDMQANGIVLQRGSRLIVNGPFQHPKVTVKC
jgi:predicted phage terminase large subunit-like protein